MERSTGEFVWIYVWIFFVPGVLTERGQEEIALFRHTGQSLYRLLGLAPYYLSCYSNTV
jgi:hypothetical protein